MVITEICWLGCECILHVDDAMLLIENQNDLQFMWDSFYVTLRSMALKLDISK